MIHIALLALASTVTSSGASSLPQPRWLKAPNADQVVSAWPIGALRRGIGGSALVTCQINPHGILENCRIDEETPPRLGFGAAALSLTPQFLFDPRRLSGQPGPPTVRIPVRFAMPRGSEGTRAYAHVAAVRVIQNPQWEAAPKFADVNSAYPRSAGDSAGYVSLRCEVVRTGWLKDCDVLQEEPAGKGFAYAAKSLARMFRLKSELRISQGEQPLRVSLPIRFPSPDSVEMRSHAIGEPIWETQVDPAGTSKLFPAAAAARGVTSGRGVAQCQVGDDGRLRGCQPAPGEGDDLGFSMSAAQVAQALQMNLWTQEGGPIDGATIRIPIRFNLVEPPPVLKP